MMARMNTTSRASTADLVDEYLESGAVAVMLSYSAHSGPNAVSLAVHDLRKGRPAVIDSALLPEEIRGEWFDRDRLTSLRLRLQRDRAPEVVEDRAPVVVEPTVEPEEAVDS